MSRRLPASILLLPFICTTLPTPAHALRAGLEEKVERELEVALNITPTVRAAVPWVGTRAGVAHVISAGLEEAAPWVRWVEPGPSAAVVYYAPTTPFAFSPDAKAMARVGWLGKDVVLQVTDLGSEPSPSTQTYYPPTTIDQLSLSKISDIPVAFSPDGATLAAWGAYSVVGWPEYDNRLVLVDRQSRQVRSVKVMGGQGMSVNAMAFTPDGQTLVLGGYRWRSKDTDKTPVAVLELATGQIRYLPEMPGQVDAVAVSNEDGAVAVGVLQSREGGRRHYFVGILERGSEGPITPLPALPSPVTALAFSPNDRLLAVGLGPQVAFQERTTGLVLTMPQTHARDLGAMAFSPDGRTLTAVSHDGKISVWDVPRIQDFLHRVLEPPSPAAGLEEQESLPSVPQLPGVQSAGTFTSADGVIEALVRLHEQRTIQAITMISQVVYEHRGRGFPRFISTFDRDSGEPFASDGFRNALRRLFERFPHRDPRWKWVNAFEVVLHPVDTSAIPDLPVAVRGQPLTVAVVVMRYADLPPAAGLEELDGAVPARNSYSGILFELADHEVPLATIIEQLEALRSEINLELVDEPEVPWARIMKEWEARSGKIGQPSAGAQRLAGEISQMLGWLQGGDESQERARQTAKAMVRAARAEAAAAVNAMLEPVGGRVTFTAEAMTDEVPPHVIFGGETEDMRFSLTIYTQGSETGGPELALAFEAYTLAGSRLYVRSSHPWPVFRVTSDRGETQLIAPTGRNEIGGPEALPVKAGVTYTITVVDESEEPARLGLVPGDPEPPSPVAGLEEVRAVLYPAQGPKLIIGPVASVILQEARQGTSPPIG